VAQPGSSCLPHRHTSKSRRGFVIKSPEARTPPARVMPMSGRIVRIGLLGNPEARRHAPTLAFPTGAPDIPGR